MIIDLHKYLIYGVKRDLEAFFNEAQENGFIEFIHLSKKKIELSSNLQKLLTAIKILKKKEAISKDVTPAISVAAIADQVIHDSETLTRLYEEKRLLAVEAVRIAPLGNFSEEDVSYLQKMGKRTLQFFCRKTGKKQSLHLPSEVLYVATEYDLDYFVAINKERKVYPGMIELIVEKPIGQILAHLDLVNSQILKFEHDLKAHTAYLPFLQEALLDELNTHHLISAKKEASRPMEGVFAVEAWIPKTKIQKMYQLIEPFAISFEPVKVEPFDVKPTYMKNRGLAKMGEDIVNIYDIPSATDKDPSPWLIFFFPLFFSMIVSDAGYGAVYLLFSLWLKKKFSKATGIVKRLIHLTFFLSIFCIGWGVCVASFFGIEISPNNPYKNLSPLHYLAQKKAEHHMKYADEVYQDILYEIPGAVEAATPHALFLQAVDKEGNYKLLNDFYNSLLLEISLLVGMIHIILSFLRHLFRNWAGAGWILFIIGGYFFFPSILKATTLVNIMGWVPKSIAYPIGKELVYWGITLASLLALIQKKWLGLLEPMNAIQVFSDILSYLRLYALALASIIMAQTFNKMGMEAGIVFGAFIILVGHSINCLLTIMGGVIHGLRLNFLEWYRYCFEGGGRMFNPLRNLKK